MNKFMDQFNKILRKCSCLHYAQDYSYGSIEQYFNSHSTFKEFCITMDPSKWPRQMLALDTREAFLIVKTADWCKRNNVGCLIVSEYSQSGDPHLHGFMWYNSNVNYLVKFIAYCKRLFGTMCTSYDLALTDTICTVPAFGKTIRKTIPSIQRRYTYLMKHVKDGKCETGHPVVCMKSSI